MLILYNDKEAAIFRTAVLYNGREAVIFRTD
jgi:hypothetical protein